MSRTSDRWAVVKNRKAAKMTLTMVGGWWLRMLPVKAFHYGRAAQRDERNGFPYTAAMEWRNAAELFAPDTLAAEYCWGQWERIMHLPRWLAQPVDASPVLAFSLKPSALQHVTAQVASTTAA